MPKDPTGLLEKKMKSLACSALPVCPSKNSKQEKRNEHTKVRFSFLVGAEIEMARLEGANSEPSEQLGTRKAMERAKGILQGDLQLSEEDTYLTLQKQNRQRRKSLREVAEAIVLTDEIRRVQSKPETS